MDFKVIVFTSPCRVDHESLMITELLDSCANFVHLRKPEAGIDEMRRLIEEIPEEFHPRIRIHDHFSLVEDYDLAGVHLNSRNPQAPAGAKTVSRSLHTLREVALPGNEAYAYSTLSPIYNSISKPGYDAAFSLEELSDAVAGKRIVALGGVRPANFSELREIGFYGAALLGYIWEGDFIKRLSDLRLCCSL